VSLKIAEAEVGNLLPDVDAMKRQLWLVMTHFRNRDDASASMTYDEFRSILKELNTKVEKIARKIEDFEANAS
jgi:hypothetical protein